MKHVVRRSMRQPQLRSTLDRRVRAEAERLKSHPAARASEQQGLIVQRVASRMCDGLIGALRQVLPDFGMMETIRS
jgi:hypothetical protein